MEQTIHESGHDTPQKDADLVQVAAVALQRCTGDDTPAEQLIRTLLMWYRVHESTLLPGDIAESLSTFRRQCKANLEAARQIAERKPWLITASDDEIAEQLSFDVDEDAEPAEGSDSTAGEGGVLLEIGWTPEPKTTQEPEQSEAPALNAEQRIRAIVTCPEAEGRRQLALVLAIELPEMPADALARILARCPRATVREACGDLGELVESIDPEVLIEHALHQMGARAHNATPEASKEEQAATEPEAGPEPTSERVGHVPDFAKLLGLGKHDAALMEATWRAIHTPRDYTTPDTELVENLLQILHRDGMITPKAIAEDLQRFRESFEDCRLIAARMRTAEAAGVRGC